MPAAKNFSYLQLTITTAAKEPRPCAAAALIGLARQIRSDILVTTHRPSGFHLELQRGTLRYLCRAACNICIVIRRADYSPAFFLEMCAIAEQSTSSPSWAMACNR